MINKYDPTNSYWNIANSTTEVFSSASASFVPMDDPDYAALLALGLSAQNLDSNQTLITFLQQFAPSVPLWNLYSLPQAQKAQIAVLTAAYEAAIIAPISFTTAAGTTAIFSQDAKAKSNLTNAITGSMATGIWAPNLWLTSTGTPITPFTHADLEGLAAAMEAVDAPDYVKLLGLIADILTISDTSSTGIAAVRAVAWS